VLLAPSSCSRILRYSSTSQEQAAINSSVMSTTQQAAATATSVPTGAAGETSTRRDSNHSVIGTSAAADAATTNYVSMDTELAEPDGIMKAVGSNNNNPNDPDNNNDNNDEDDDDEDLPGDMGSIASSVLTADGIHDYPGFLCVCMVILVGDSTYYLLLISMHACMHACNSHSSVASYC